MAIAFSALLLPVTVDLLFFRRGSKAGAAASIIVGLLVLLLFPPLANLFFGPEHGLTLFTTGITNVVDTSFSATLVSTVVYVTVSMVTAKPSPEATASFARDLLPPPEKPRPSPR